MDPEKQRKMHELAVKMDKDIDAYMDELAAKKAANPEPKKEFNFEEWEKEIDNHPAFMKTLPKLQEGEEMPEAMQALQALKYSEEDSPEERAEQFKIDGNKQFKYKRYRSAVDCYTEGLKVRCADLELNAILYANRAAAQCHLDNYRSALKDCVLARKFKPDHRKVTLRGIDCMLKLNMPDEALEWITSLETSFEEVDNVRDVREKAESMQKLKERDRRKGLSETKKDLQAKMKILMAFKVRGLNFRDLINLDDPTSLEWSDLQVSMPQLPEPAKVKLEKDGNLVWPVIFLYPESNQSDIVQEFFEEVTFKDQLEVVFENRPKWDTEGVYGLSNIEIYFESWLKPEQLCRVPLDWKLGDALSSPHYSIPTALPAFLLLSKASAFRDQYLSRYSIIEL